MKKTNIQSLHQSIIRILSSFWTYGLIEFNENIENLTCRESKCTLKWNSVVIKDRERDYNHERISMYNLNEIETI
jgi:hypothetical protein